MTCPCLVSPQLLNGLGVLQKNTLAPLKQEFVAHSIISTYKNLTAQDFLRSLLIGILLFHMYLESLCLCFP